MSAPLCGLDSVEENHEMERFFSGLPNFRSSEKITILCPVSVESKIGNLWEIRRVLDRTFLSDWVSESVKNLASIICMKAIEPAGDHPCVFPDPRLCHVQGPITWDEDRQFCPHRQVPRPSWRPTPCIRLRDAIVTYILAA